MDSHTFGDDPRFLVRWEYQPIATPGQNSRFGGVARRDHLTAHTLRAIPVLNWHAEVRVQRHC